MKFITNLLFLLVFGWLNQYPLACQTFYFNKTIDLANDWGAGMSVLSVDSLYYIAAITGPGKMVSIIEVGQLGNQNWIKKYGNPNESWYPGSPGSLCPVPSGGYILGGSIDTIDNDYGFLLKFNHLFDTLFQKRYESNVNHSLILTCAKPTYEGGSILTGEIYIGGINTDFILLKTDSQGNEIWRTIKNIGYADRGWSNIQIPDSGYVVGGYTYNPGIHHSGDPMIVKFDKNGTYRWQRNPGGPYEDGKAMICLNADSTFTVLTTIADSIYINDFDYTRICVIKYTQDGAELWKRKYGESIGGNFVSNIKPLPDGGYICCGRQREPGNNDIYRFGWLLRLDMNGDSIWFRKYTYSEDPPFYYNSLEDVVLTQDGGFIATGQVWDDDPPNTLQKVWVLKVDSIGCDTAGCDPTVGIAESGEAGKQGSGEAGKRGELVVWPNPARDEIHVRFYRDDGRFDRDDGRLDRDLGLEIYDIFGRRAPEVLHSSPQVGGGWEGGWTEWTGDVSDFPPGMYLIIVKDGLMVLTSRKFLKVR